MLRALKSPKKPNKTTTPLAAILHSLQLPSILKKREKEDRERRWLKVCLWACPPPSAKSYLECNNIVCSVLFSLKRWLIIISIKMNKSFHL